MMASIDSTFRGRSVFVTGHTGFKGSWLSLWLSQLGAEIHGYSDGIPTRPTAFEMLGIPASLASDTRGDIADADGVAAAVARAAPSVVFHMAAQPIVREGFRRPYATFATNVMGTAAVLEAARHVRSVEAVVVVTSDKCYENREWLWSYREKSALGGRDPYSASKAAAELVTRAYRESFFSGDGAARIATARAGNVIGGGDWAEDRLVPDTIRALVAGRPVDLRYPSAIRPWQHVLDPLAGYLRLAELLHGPEGAAVAEAWNFAPHEEDARSVGWLVEQLQRAWGATPSWQPQEGPRPHEHIFLKLDSTRARVELAWSPQLRIDETVRWVTDWYRGFEAGDDPRELVARQLVAYSERLGAALGVHESLA